jgi:hypothetical protein
MAQCLPAMAAPGARTSLIENYWDKVFPAIRNMGYRSARKRRWKYIRYRHLKGADELYDRQADPAEMTSLIACSRVPRDEMKARAAWPPIR